MDAMRTIDKANDRYMELVGRFSLRPIRSEEDHALALEVVDALLMQPETTAEEADYLAVLSRLVGDYEDTYHPLPALSDADMLRHLIDSRGLTQARVASDVGIPESTVSEVLSGRRRLNRGHIEALARYFKVSPAVFLGAD